VMIPIALFFDLDGTLVDSERYHWRAWQATLQPLNVDLPWQVYQKEGIGHPDPVILRRLTQGISNAALLDHTHILQMKEKHFIRIIRGEDPISKEVRELLQEIRERPLAVVTSSPRREAAALLECAAVSWAFRTVVCLEDVRSHKPDPEPYRMAMERLQVKKGIAFEDSESGMASARSAGLEVVCVSIPSELPELVRARLTIPRSEIRNSR